MRARVGAFLVLCLVALGCAPRGRPAKPNLVLIVIDTLRADHLGCYGYHRATSPHMDRLAGQGALFERAMSTAPYTRPSTASILTGLYPSVHGAITHADSISTGVPTLAERLAESGYRTAGFYRNGNVSDRFGFDRGFETYVVPDKEYWTHRRAQNGGTIDDSLVSQVDDSLLAAKVGPFLRDVDTLPFFLYLHLGGAHDPYTPPRDFVSFLDQPLDPALEGMYLQPVKALRKEPTLLEDLAKGRVSFSERQRNQLVALYDGEVAFADHQIGVVLQALTAAGLDEETIVVLTADHGEEFLDHSGLGHGHSNYQELLHVPLVIAGPGIAVRRIHEPVSLIDIVPTVLDMAGAEVPDGLPGKSLWSVVQSHRKIPAPDSVYAEGLLRFLGNGDPLLFRSLQLGDAKIVLDFEKHTKALFDLGTDTGETVDHLASRPRLGRQLFEELLTIHHRNLDSPYLAPLDAVHIPEDLEAELRALGYVGGKEDSDSASLFRRPLRRSDLGSHGFMGHEREVAEYGFEVNFSTGGYHEEQLLYGWQRAREGKRTRGLARKAGVRLKRLPAHDSWRLRATVRRREGAPGSLTVQVRVGDSEPQSYAVEAGRRFELRGPLGAADDAFVRLDVECGEEFFLRGRDRIISDYEFCMVVRFVGLEEAGTGTVTSLGDRAAGSPAASRP